MEEMFRRREINRIEVIGDSPNVEIRNLRFSEELTSE